MIGELDSADNDGRTMPFRRLWAEALLPGKVRDDLEQFGNTVPLSDEDIEWLEKEGLNSAQPLERELAANLLGAGHIAISGECVKKLMVMVSDTNEYAPARIQAALALWSKGINREQVRPLFQEARERRLSGTPEEMDKIQAIAVDVLTERVSDQSK